MDNLKCKKDWNHVLFLLLILIQIAVILHYTFERHNLFVDEVWTFNTSNHYYFPFLFQSTEPYRNQWLPKSFWANSLVVNPNHTFSYDSVFYNMSLDNQPLLYFMVIHTICSLFPGEFSRWFGIVPNLAFFVLIQMMLYVIALKIFGKHIVALGLCLLFGSCWGTINNVMLIRMYVMLTFFALLTYWAHLQMLEEVKEQRSSKKILFLIYFFSIFGFLTHYYFLIYISYLFFGTVVLLLLYHRTKIIKRYFLTLLGALLSCLLINPCIPAQFIGTTGNQGAQTWRNLVQSDFIHRVIIMSKLVSQDMLGNKAHVVILIVLVWFLIQVVSNIRKKNSSPDFSDIETATSEKDSRTFSFSTYSNTIHSGLFLAVFTSVGYFMTVSKIVPYYQNRYLYIIYPLIIICLFSLVYSVLNSLKFSQGLSLMLAVLLILGLNVNYYKRSNIKFLNDAYPRMLATIKRNYSDVNMITVCKSDSWWPVVTHLLVFREVPNTLMLEEKQLANIERIINSLPSNPEKFLIYRGNDCKVKPKVFLKTVKQLSGYKKHRLIYKNWEGEIYFFE